MAKFKTESPAPIAAAPPSKVAPSPPPKLLNRSKTIQVFNLPHAEFCGQGACICTKKMLELSVLLPDGTRGRREEPRLISESLTLLAGETKEVDERVLQVGSVKTALAKGTLRLVQQ